jgi:hypothetical protein
MRAELARLLGPLGRDVALEDVVMLLIALGWAAGWAMRAHDRRVWAEGLAAGVAMQRVVEEHNAARPDDRAELSVHQGGPL